MRSEYGSKSFAFRDPTSTAQKSPYYVWFRPHKFTGPSPKFPQLLPRVSSIASVISSTRDYVQLAPANRNHSTIAGFLEKSTRVLTCRTIRSGPVVGIQGNIRLLQIMMTSACSRFETAPHYPRRAPSYFHISKYKPYMVYYFTSYL